MKKGILFGFMILIVLTLAACGQETRVAWECVEDEIPVLSTEPLSRYHITFGVPQDAIRETFGGGEDTAFYTGAEGDYEILTQRLEGDSIETIAKTLTGFRFDELEPVRQTQFDMNRYDFTWAATDEDGQKVCRAAVLEDKGAYYVVTFSVREEAAKDCSDKMEQVFSTIGLNGDEGV